MSVEKLAPHAEALVAQPGEDLLVSLGAAMLRLGNITTDYAGGFVFRPARYAAELRRLIRSAPNHLPAATVARTWRSLVGDAMAANGLKAVNVAGGDPIEMIEGARGYFGFGPKVSLLPEIREVLERAGEQPGVLACLPWPEQAGAGQWWPMLYETKYRHLAIVAGWPALPDEPNAKPKIAVIGRCPIEPSGSDESFAAAHDDNGQGDRILASVGLKGEVTARVRSLSLIRFPDYIAPDDPRLAAAEEAGLDGLRIVGVRPRP